MDKQQIGARIKDIRTSMCLTQEDFTAVFNAKEPQNITITRSDLSRYELGLNMCPTDKYLKFISIKETPVE